MSSMTRRTGRTVCVCQSQALPLTSACTYPQEGLACDRQDDSRATNELFLSAQELVLAPKRQKLPSATSSQASKPSRRERKPDRITC